jgi:CheY-like chemotaxis protein
MKVLIVEDRPDSIEALKEAFAGTASVFTYVLSRSAAFAAIAQDTFDLALLDLKIPPEDNSLQPDISHGKAVYYEIVEKSPGTPVIFQTAYGTEDFISDLMLNAKSHDGWGSGQTFPMVFMLRKDRLPELVDHVKNLCRIFSETDQVEVSAGAHGIELKELDKRVLKIFCRRHDGVHLELSELTGGLSGERVFGAKVISQHGETIIYTAAKIGTLATVDNEVRKYHSEVIRLPPGAFPQFCGQVVAGAGNRAGIFYRLAEDYKSSLFMLLSQDPARAAAVVQRIRRFEVPWQEHAPESVQTTRDVRHMIVHDEDFEATKDQLDGLGIDALEATPVHVKVCSQHCDLHGSNILVDEVDTPILIDFQQVGRCPSAFDPITLELSILFHPDAVSLRGDWATPETVARWHELEFYQAAGPFGPFIQACREWMFQVAGARAVYSTVYAYAVKQLKYPDTDHRLALALITSAMKGLYNT